MHQFLEKLLVYYDLVAFVVGHNTCIMNLDQPNMT